MKRMKNILKLSLLVLLCGALLFAFACGDKTDKQQPDGPDDGGSSQTPDDPNQGGTTPVKPDDPTPPADEKIEVTIDLADGSAPTVKKVKKGEKLDKPYDPTRTGFTFKEWQKDGKAYDFNAAVDAPFTITATWTMDPAVVPALEEVPESVKAAPFAGGSVEVKVKETRGYSYTFKWYINDKNENSGGTLIEGQTAAGAALPRNLEKGKDYWVYCEVTGTRNASGATASSMSDPIKVEVEDRTISVLMVGSGVMARGTAGAEHDSALFLQTMARASGKGVTVDKLTVGSNYNIWESGLVGDGFLTVQAMYELRHYDFVVLQLGRDYCMVPGSGTRNSDFAAVTSIYAMCKEMNPGVTVIPMISYARQDTTSKYYTDPYTKHDPVITNREEHSAAIQMYWDEKKELLDIPYIVSDMNSVFEACLAETDINPWGNETSDFADLNGSYLMACALYATIFDESPVGVMCFDAGKYSVKPTDGVQLQALAAKQVLGIETETLPDVSGYVKYVDTWVDPDAPVDPKSLDPAYKYPNPTELSTYPETKYTETMEVAMFGGYPIGVYNMEKTLVEMMQREENKKVNLHITWLGHSSESTTYNLYELFESSARTDMNTLGFSSYGEKLKNVLTTKKLDYVIIQSGRDFSMENDNSKIGNVVSATKFAMLAAQQNPDVKFIIYAPYGHNANFSDFYTIGNLEQHVPVINAEAEAMRDSIVNGGYLPAEQVKIAYVSSAFLNYSDNADDITNDLYQKKNVIATRANTGNRASEAGAYLAAATLYATIYDKTPVGMTYSGFAGSESAPGVVTDGAMLLKLQKTAHKTVFGTEYDGTVSTQSTLNFFTNGGSAVAPITAEAGAEITAPADPTNGNLLFAGWFYDPDFTTRFSFMFDRMPLGNTTIYGAWANKDGIVAEKPVDKTPAPTFTMPTDDTAPVTAAGETLNVWSFGGQMYGSYNMIGTLVEMIKEGTDKEVVAHIDSYLGHSNVNTTWNLYELFDSSVRGKEGEIKFVNSGAGNRVSQELTNNSYDVIIMQLGRDFSLMEVNTSYNYNVIAARKIAQLAAAKNPNVKILLVAPYGHTIAWDDFKSVGLDNHAKHVKFINYEAVRAYEAIKADGVANVEIVSVGSLFECYSDSELKIYQDLFRAPDSATTRANLGNRATAKGSYLAAAGIYAAMFDKSPEGLTTLGADILDTETGAVKVACKVDAATAAAMQKLAAEYVLGGKVPTEKPDEKVTIEVVTPDAPTVDIEKDTTAPVSTANDTIKVWAFGGQMMGSHNPLVTLKDMIKEGTGKQVTVEGTWLDHVNGNTTWNIYELFASSARDKINDMTFGSSASCQRIAGQLNGTAYDCVIIQTGRDFSLVPNSAQYENNAIAARKIAKLAAQQNPNVKILLLAPYGHTTAWGDFTSMGVDSHAEHVKYINAEAVRIKTAILADGYAKNVEVLSAGDLFESYNTSAAAIAADLFRPANDVTTRANTANRANAKGSYLVACALYSAMFDKSCVGLTTNGNKTVDADGNVTLDSTVDAATMTAMQTLAAGFVNGDITPVDKPDVPGGTIPPVDPTIPDETVEGAVNVFVFGGQAMGSFGMFATLENMIAEETGKDVVTHVDAYLGHSNGSTTWNVWELFASGARKSPTDMTFGTSATCQKAEQKLKSVKFDYVFIQTGRDMSLVDGSSYDNYTEYAAAKIAKLAYAKNPNVKIILVAPYGHQATFNDFTNPVITNHATHVKYIDMEAAATAGYIKSQGVANVEVVSLGSLFEAYSTDANTIKTDLFRAPDSETGRKNVGNRANEKGTYLAACGIFAAMFDKSPVGLQVLGEKGLNSDGSVKWNAELDAATAGELQALAAKIITGEIEQPTPVDPQPSQPTQPEVSDTTVEGAVNMYVFGGMTMGSYNMTDTLVQMIQAGQNKPVNIVKAIPTHGTTWTTYNMYELFASSARNSETDMTIGSTDTKNGYASTKFDYIVLQSGRDFSINSESSKTQNLYSAYKLAKLATDKNPNCKVIIVAPYGHQATFGDFTNVTVTNHAEHAKLIDAEAKEMADFIKSKGISNVEAVSIASLFESYSTDAAVIKTDLFRAPDEETSRKNVGNRANAKGAYLAACAIYAAMFDESPVGVGCLGSNVQGVDATVDVETAIAMQKLATKFVLNKDVEAATTFTVSFDTAGGSEIEAVTAEMGTALTAPADPVKDGHVFSGWYTDFEYNNKFSFEGATVPYGGLTLRAKWLTEKEATRPAYWVEPNAKEFEGKELTVLLVGSLSMSYSSKDHSFDATEYLAELLEKGGYDAEIRTVIGNGSWNIWETGLVGDGYSKVRTQLQDGEVDVVILQVGRDYALVNVGSTGANDIRAIKGIADLAKAYNPNVKVVLDGMFARQDAGTSYFKEFAKNHVSTRAQHSDAINRFIKENVLPSVTFDATVMSLANAFERCLSKTDINPYVSAGSDQASNEGSYLIACCMYTAITGKSPVGLMRFESDNYSVLPTVGAKLQAIAAEVVLDLENVEPAAVTDSYKERTTVNVLLAGNITTTTNGVADMIKSIAAETGKELILTAVQQPGSIEEMAASEAFKNQILYGGIEYDYVIVEACKDECLYDTAAFDAQAAALKTVRELAQQNNAKAKVMILAPMARQNTTGKYYRDQVANNGIASRADYTLLIEASAKKLAGETDTVISYATAVEACIANGVNPYANSISDNTSLAGSYLAACSIYAEIFQASPATAIYAPYGISAADAAVIQNAAVMAILG